MLKGILKRTINEMLNSNRCVICSKDKGNNENVCDNCFLKFKNSVKLQNVENIFYMSYYEEDMRKLIITYKKRGNKLIGNVIARLIRDGIKKVIEENDIDVVIPVPLNKKRENERGFNQITYVLDKLKIKYREIKRTKNTHYMFDLKSYEERRKNIKNAFDIDIVLEDKTILVVDDIITSGSTMSEIEREIKRNYNIKKIYFFTFSVAKSFVTNGGKLESIHR